MIFQSDIQHIDTELSQLQALLDAKRQQRSLFEELDAETNAAIEKVALLKTKIEAVSVGAIASLKSAVLTLFDNGDNGNGGGNHPIEPTPGPDDDEPELLCLNGETGEALTTADLDDEYSTHPHKAALNGQACEWSSPFASHLACLLWEDAPLTGQTCEWASLFASPLACLIEPIPQPQKSSTELIHLSSNCGYLKLKNDDSILAVYCWFSRKNIAEAWASEIEVIPTVKTELRESKRNSSWKWELKISGLGMNQIERLAMETLHQKPSKQKQTLAQAAGIEPPSGWRQPQQPEVRVTAEAPKKARITLESSPYNGHVCDVVEVSHNWWTLATPKGNLKYPADSVEPVDDAVQMAESEQEAEAIAFEFGDIAEVTADLNGTHLVGSFGKVKFVKDGRVSLEIDEQIAFFQPEELKLRSKAEESREQQQLQTGQVLLNNRVVTTGAYIGAARRTAIANARRGTANKIAALELVKAGLSPELAMAAAMGASDDASDF